MEGPWSYRLARPDRRVACKRSERTHNVPLMYGRRGYRWQDRTATGPRARPQVGGGDWMHIGTLKNTPVVWDRISHAVKILARRERRLAR